MQRHPTPFGEAGTVKGEVFRENVVVITGASSGIGREVALQLAEQGAWLVLASPETDRLESVAAACRARGSKALVITTDVSDQAQCKALIDRAVEAYGRLDTLINNAGLGLIGKLENLTDLAPFERVMRVNFLGSVYCTYYALPHLRRSGGRIVGVSSVMGKFAAPRATAYCASKHALAGFYDALRHELRHRGVSVTVICPNLVVTEFAERLLESDGRRRGERGRAAYTKHMMRPETCARLIIKAAARRRRERVISLSAKVALWFRLIAPRLLDSGMRRRLRRWR